MLFELLTGRPPFHRDSAVESMAAIVRDDLPPLDPAIEAQAPALGPLLARCVEKLPADRFESVRDFAYSLEALSRSLGALPPGQRRPTSRRREPDRGPRTRGRAASRAR